MNLCFAVDFSKNVFRKFLADQFLSQTTFVLLALPLIPSQQPTFSFLSIDSSYRLEYPHRLSLQSPVDYHFREHIHLLQEKR